MTRISSILLIFFLLVSTMVKADQDIVKTTDKETMGFGIGALIGGLLAGPPGAVIGAASGTIFGNNADKKDQSLAKLEKQLLDKEIELSFLQKKLAQSQSEHSRIIHKVLLEKKQETLKELSKGISFSIYFRTSSAEIDQTLQPHIHELVSLIKDFPEINVQLNAHADHRGNKQFNMKLSRSRAAAVEDELCKAGLSGIRVQKHAYGESQARIHPGDKEGYIFDRRVDINLTVDTEV